MEIASGEQCVRLSELQAILPVSASYRTLLRWAKTGVRAGRSDRTVKLETTKVGGHRYSSLAAYHRFVARCNETDPALAEIQPILGAARALHQQETSS